MKNILEESQEERDIELSEYSGLSIDELKAMKIGSKPTIMLFRDEDITASSYNFIYEDYKYLKIEGYLRTLSAFSVTRRAPYIKILHKHIGKFENKHILDFGCGVGTHGIYCAQMGAKVDFLDVNGPLFDYAKYRINNRSIKDTKFLYTDSGLEPEKYDAIICLDVLEHIANPVEVFRKLVKSLKPGGFLSLEVSSMIKPTSGHFSQGILLWKNKGIKYLQKKFKKIALSLYRKNLNEK